MLFEMRSRSLFILGSIRAYGCITSARIGAKSKRRKRRKSIRVLITVQSLIPPNHCVLPEARFTKKRRRQDQHSKNAFRRFFKNLLTGNAMGKSKKSTFLSLSLTEKILFDKNPFGAWHITATMNKIQILIFYNNKTILLNTDKSASVHQSSLGRSAIVWFKKTSATPTTSLR